MVKQYADNCQTYMPLVDAIPHPKFMELGKEALSKLSGSSDHIQHIDILQDKMQPWLMFFALNRR